MVAMRFGWIVHVYTLMTNHFHLLIETPCGGLSRGMQQMLTKYAQGKRVTSSFFVLSLLTLILVALGG